MPVNPKDFFEISQMFTAEIGSEISYRTAINRVYYSLFHLVKNTTKEIEGYKYKGKSKDHGITIEAVKDICGKDIADDYQSLFEARKDSDYNLDKKIDELEYDHWKHKYKEISEKFRKEAPEYEKLEKFI